MSKAMFIVNPVAGNGRNKELEPRFTTKLHEHYETVTVKYTEKRGDGTRFSCLAADEKYDAVFALGGDGTVHECVNGLVEKEYRPDFGFLPGGTVNNLSNQLHMPQRVNQAIDSFVFDKKEKLDIGIVNHQYFVSSVTTGVVADTFQEMRAGKENDKGFWEYVKYGLESLREKQGTTFLLTLDGKEEILESSLITVILGGGVGGVQRALPDATLKDGFLHIVALKGDTLLDKWTVIPKLMSGEFSNDDRFFYQPVQKATIQVLGDVPLLSNIDGEQGDALPLALSVLHQHLTFFVP